MVCAVWSNNIAKRPLIACISRSVSFLANPNPTEVLADRPPRRLFVGDNNNNNNNNNNVITRCDVALMDCMKSEICEECFSQMTLSDVAWTAVAPETDCDVVVPILNRLGLCNRVGTGSERDLFCETFHSCVTYNAFDDDDATKPSEDDDADTWVDCSALTKCDWPGMHASFLGDEICQDNFNSCYNTAICNWDGGDCCEETCQSDKGDDGWNFCGSDGYACLNPASANCDPSLTLECSSDKYNANDDDKPRKCAKGEMLYRLNLYDSFGDGWEGTTLTIADKTGGSGEPIFDGALESGALGTAFLCLSVDPKCYSVQVVGGQWGREVSWDIRGYVPGSPSIASGTGVMKCEFPLAGFDGSSSDCRNNCNGRADDLDPGADPDYKDYKDLSKCIDDKCVIQAETCRSVTNCGKCFQEVIPAECFTIAEFNAVTDCAVCKCSDVSDDEALSKFCANKSAPGAPVKPANGGKGKQCTPGEVFDGSTAILQLTKCMHFWRDDFTIQEWDQNNFGLLDSFEECSHSFQNDENHGGRTALSCMQILKKAITPEAQPGSPSEMISTLATLLYEEGGSFCDCARKASDECPLCAHFFNLKTLLYESMDACKSLDEIDCAAWDEFQKPCQTKMMTRFGSIDFSKPEQCSFVVDGCDGAGPFPSFRRLDCETELPGESWDLYKRYERSCVSSAPVPAAPVPTASTPTASVPSPVADPTGKTPYVPPEERGKPSYKSSDEKKSSHWFRNLFVIGILGGVGYYLFQRRSEFSFVRYRRIGGPGGGMGFRSRGGGYDIDDGDIYSGLAMESSTISFEPPPQLPQMPMTMPNNGGYGA